MSALTDIDSALREQWRMGAGDRLRAIVLRDVWLPLPIYAAVPWVYLAGGTICFFGGLYLPDWAWTFPYLALLGLALGHAGLAVASLRHRRRSAAPPAVVPESGGQ